MYENELKYAKEAAVLAGKRILEIYKTEYDVIEKDDESPVTMADFEANKIIIHHLKSRFPGYGVLSEETEDDLSRLDKKYCWIIDPLDGTKEFIKKNNDFAVNIALSCDQEIILGVIYAPFYDELYYAVKGEGAYIEKNEISKKIHVSDRKNNLHILRSRSHNTAYYDDVLMKNKEQIAIVKRVGSSLKGCLVASGRFDVYYNFGNTMVWDVAPLETIVTEAGGVFLNMDETKFTYNTKRIKNENGFIVLNHKDNKFIL